MTFTQKDRAKIGQKAVNSALSEKMPADTGYDANPPKTSYMGESGPSQTFEPQDTGWTRIPKGNDYYTKAESPEVSAAKLLAQKKKHAGKN